MPEPVRIRTAADLFTVLTTGSFVEQAAVLKSVSQKPERALLLGKHQGEDFIDLLVRLIPESEGGIRSLQLFCLSLYDDPRVTPFMLGAFEKSRDAASVLHLARRLALDQAPEFFREFLWRDDKPAQSLAAARILSGSQELGPAERLRIAVFLDRDFDPPSLCPENLDLWLAELSGPHRRRVRRLAERLGEEALVLWSRFESLGPDEREWLVALTAELQPSLARDHLSRILRQESVSLPMVRLALELGLELPARLLDNEDERVRALAIEQGLGGERLEAFLSASVPEAVAATRRCSTERLLELLADPRWQVRAAATGTLAGQAEIPLQEVRRRAKSELQGERVAAIELLLKAGDDTWLAEQLGSAVDRLHVNAIEQRG